MTRRSIRSIALGAACLALAAGTWATAANASQPQEQGSGTTAPVAETPDAAAEPKADDPAEAEAVAVPDKATEAKEEAVAVPDKATEAKAEAVAVPDKATGTAPVAPPVDAVVEPDVAAEAPGGEPCEVLPADELGEPFPEAVEVCEAAAAQPDETKTVPGK
ncbi:hypothetical protein [Streptomyces spiramenti]|uniref:Secreted protein n=1 Tax=Streptomyces spiramenti TaxID=2720606 RepID=A0ABX1AXU4_9ACTN|nr:hypothetical protein [Streptomyces spiramenti]NJP69057.1 hypothetical protein [Streptomyces spiramenti]